MSPNPTSNTGRTIVVISVMLIIAAFHLFRVGTYFSGRAFTLYYSYFSDIMIPFGMYFLLCISDVSIRPLRDWRIKAAVVFAIACCTEIAQAFGVPLLGLTFDPVDFLMFGLGVLLAVVVDQLLFTRMFPFWGPPGACDAA